VETQMEMLGAYRKDRTTLHIEKPVQGDLYVDVCLVRLTRHRRLRLPPHPRSGRSPEPLPAPVIQHLATSGPSSRFDTPRASPAIRAARRRRL
jgi:hypothetical protein